MLSKVQMKLLRDYLISLLAVILFLCVMGLTHRDGIVRKKSPVSEAQCERFE